MQPQKIDLRRFPMLTEKAFQLSDDSQERQAYELKKNAYLTVIYKTPQVDDKFSTSPSSQFQQQCTALIAEIKRLANDNLGTLIAAHTSLQEDYRFQKTHLTSLDTLVGKIAEGNYSGIETASTEENIRHKNAFFGKLKKYLEEILFCINTQLQECKEGNARQGILKSMADTYYNFGKGFDKNICTAGALDTVEKEYSKWCGKNDLSGLLLEKRKDIPNRLAGDYVDREKEKDTQAFDGGGYEVHVPQQYRYVFFMNGAGIPVEIEDKYKGTVGRASDAKTVKKTADEEFKDKFPKQYNYETVCDTVARAEFKKFQAIVAKYNVADADMKEFKREMQPFLDCDICKETDLIVTVKLAAENIEIYRVNPTLLNKLDYYCRQYSPKILQREKYVTDIDACPYLVTIYKTEAEVALNQVLLSLTLDTADVNRWGVDNQGNNFLTHPLRQGEVFKFMALLHKVADAEDDKDVDKDKKSASGPAAGKLYFNPNVADKSGETPLAIIIANRPFTPPDSKDIYLLPWQQTMALRLLLEHPALTFKDITEQTMVEIKGLGPLRDRLANENCPLEVFSIFYEGLYQKARDAYRLELAQQAIAEEQDEDSDEGEEKKKKPVPSLADLLAKGEKILGEQDSVVVDAYIGEMLSAYINQKNKAGQAGIIPIVSTGSFAKVHQLLCKVPHLDLSGIQHLPDFKTLTAPLDSKLKAAEVKERTKLRKLLYLPIMIRDNDIKTAKQLFTQLVEENKDAKPADKIKIYQDLLTIVSKQCTAVQVNHFITAMAKDETVVPFRLALAAIAPEAVDLSGGMLLQSSDKGIIQWETLLRLAIRRKDFEQVGQLIAWGADPSVEVMGVSALALAVTPGVLDVPQQRQMMPLLLSGSQLQPQQRQDLLTRMATSAGTYTGFAMTWEHIQEEMKGENRQTYRNKIGLLRFIYLELERQDIIKQWGVLNVGDLGDKQRESIIAELIENPYVELAEIQEKDGYRSCNQEALQQFINYVCAEREKRSVEIPKFIRSHLKTINPHEVFKITLPTDTLIKTHAHSAEPVMLANDYEVFLADSRSSFVNQPDAEGYPVLYYAVYDFQCDKIDRLLLELIELDFTKIWEIPGILEQDEKEQKSASPIENNAVAVRQLCQLLHLLHKETIDDAQAKLLFSKLVPQSYPYVILLKIIANQCQKNYKQFFANLVTGEANPDCLLAISEYIPIDLLGPLAEAAKSEFEPRIFNNIMEKLKKNNQLSPLLAEQGLQGEVAVVAEEETAEEKGEKKPKLIQKEVQQEDGSSLLSLSSPGLYPSESSSFPSYSSSSSSFSSSSSPSSLSFISLSASSLLTTVKDMGFGFLQAFASYPNRQQLESDHKLLEKKNPSVLVSSPLQKVLTALLIKHESEHKNGKFEKQFAKFKGLLTHAPVMGDLKDCYPFSQRRFGKNKQDILIDLLFAIQQQDWPRAIANYLIFYKMINPNQVAENNIPIIPEEINTIITMQLGESAADNFTKRLEAEHQSNDFAFMVRCLVNRNSDAAVNRFLTVTNKLNAKAVSNAAGLLLQLYFVVGAKEKFFAQVENFCNDLFKNKQVSPVSLEIILHVFNYDRKTASSLFLECCIYDSDHGDDLLTDSKIISNLDAMHEKISLGYGSKSKADIFLKSILRDLFIKPFYYKEYPQLLWKSFAYLGYNMRLLESSGNQNIGPLETTPLFYFLRTGQYEILDKLLVKAAGDKTVNIGLNEHDAKGVNALMHAIDIKESAERYKFLDKLLALKPSREALCHFDGADNTVFMHAVMSNDSKTVRAVMQYAMEVYANDRQQLTAWASKNIRGRTAFTLAYRNNYDDIILYLLETVPVDPKDYEANPLQADIHGEFKPYQFYNRNIIGLLRVINSSTEDYLNDLFDRCFPKNYDLQDSTTRAQVLRLLDIIALQIPPEKAIKFFTFLYEEYYFSLPIKDNIPILTKLFSLAPDMSLPTGKNDERQPVLIYTIFTKNIELFNFLLEAKLDPKLDINQTTKRKETALYIVTSDPIIDEKTQIHVVTRLLECKVDTRIRSLGEQTVFHIALTSNCYFQTFLALFDYDAEGFPKNTIEGLGYKITELGKEEKAMYFDKDKQECRRRSTLAHKKLHFFSLYENIAKAGEAKCLAASQTHFLELWKLFDADELLNILGRIKKKVSGNFTIFVEKCLEMHASELLATAKGQKFLSHFFNEYRISESLATGDSLLHWLIRQNTPEAHNRALQLITLQQIDATAMISTNKQGLNPLMLLLLQPVKDSVSYMNLFGQLLAATVTAGKVDAVSGVGTALMCAVQQTDSSAAALLAFRQILAETQKVEHGKGINQQDGLGYTALRLAVNSQQLEKMRELLEVKGLDQLIEDKQGLRPIEAAHQLKEFAMVNLFFEKDSDNSIKLYLIKKYHDQRSGRIEPSAALSQLAATAFYQLYQQTEQTCKTAGSVEKATELRQAFLQQHVKTIGLPALWSRDVLKFNLLTILSTLDTSHLALLRALITSVGGIQHEQEKKEAEPWLPLAIRPNPLLFKDIDLWLQNFNTALSADMLKALYDEPLLKPLWLHAAFAFAKNFTEGAPANCTQNPELIKVVEQLLADALNYPQEMARNRQPSVLQILNCLATGRKKLSLDLPQEQQRMTTAFKQAALTGRDDIVTWLLEHSEMEVKEVKVQEVKEKEIKVQEVKEKDIKEKEIKVQEIKEKKVDSSLEAISSLGTVSSTSVHTVDVNAVADEKQPIIFWVLQQIELSKTQGADTDVAKWTVIAKSIIKHPAWRSTAVNEEGATVLMQTVANQELFTLVLQRTPLQAQLLLDKTGKSVVDHLLSEIDEKKDLIKNPTQHKRNLEQLQLGLAEELKVQTQHVELTVKEKQIQEDKAKIVELRVLYTSKQKEAEKISGELKAMQQGHSDYKDKEKRHTRLTKQCAEIGKEIAKWNQPLLVDPIQAPLSINYPQLQQIIIARLKYLHYKNKQMMTRESLNPEAVFALLQAIQQPSAAHFQGLKRFYAEHNGSAKNSRSTEFLNFYNLIFHCQMVLVPENCQYFIIQDLLFLNPEKVAADKFLLWHSQYVDTLSDSQLVTLLTEIQAKVIPIRFLNFGEILLNKLAVPALIAGQYGFVKMLIKARLTTAMPGAQPTEKQLPDTIQLQQLLWTTNLVLSWPNVEAMRDDKEKVLTSAWPAAALTFAKTFARDEERSETKLAAAITAMESLLNDKKNIETFARGVLLDVLDNLYTGISQYLQSPTSRALVNVEELQKKMSVLFNKAITSKGNAAADKIRWLLTHNRIGYYGLQDQDSKGTVTDIKSVDKDKDKDKNKDEDKDKDKKGINKPPNNFSPKSSIFSPLSVASTPVVSTLSGKQTESISSWRQLILLVDPWAEVKLPGSSGSSTTNFVSLCLDKIQNGDKDLYGKDNTHFYVGYLQHMANYVWRGDNNGKIGRGLVKAAQCDSKVFANILMSTPAEQLIMQDQLKGTTLMDQVLTMYASSTRHDHEQLLAKALGSELQIAVQRIEAVFKFEKKPSKIPAAANEVEQKLAASAGQLAQWHVQLESKAPDSIDYQQLQEKINVATITCRHLEAELDILRALQAGRDVLPDLFTLAQGLVGELTKFHQAKLPQSTLPKSTRWSVFSSSVDEQKSRALLALQTALTEPTVEHIKALINQQKQMEKFDDLKGIFAQLPNLLTRWKEVQETIAARAAQQQRVALTSVPVPSMLEFLQ